MLLDRRAEGLDEEHVPFPAVGLQLRFQAVVGEPLEPDREQRLAWYLLQIEMVQMLATPEDRESALALQGLGLGQIVEREEGRWEWAPGSSP